MSGNERVTRPLLLEIASASIGQARKESLSVFDTAVLIALSIAVHFGNERVYIPSGAVDSLRDSTAERDAAVFDGFNGRNSLQLAKQYGITQRHVQRIVVRERTRRRQERDAGFRK